MTRYTFLSQDHEHGQRVGVQIDTDDETIDEIVGAFVQFLTALTFQKETIAKYISHELVE